MTAFLGHYREREGKRSSRDLNQRLYRMLLSQVQISGHRWENSSGITEYPSPGQKGSWLRVATQSWRLKTVSSGSAEFSLAHQQVVTWARLAPPWEQL